MRLRELFESVKQPVVEAGPAIGRKYQHIEDLVFTNGAAGGLHAVERLRDMAEQGGSIELKWDGCIHKDSVILTTSGDKTIEEVTNLIKQGTEVVIIGKDMELMIDRKSNVLAECVSIGIKDWIELELENGSILKLTVDHKVYTTNRGWIEAELLTTDDDIAELSSMVTVPFIDK